MASAAEQATGITSRCSGRYALLAVMPQGRTRACGSGAGDKTLEQLTHALSMAAALTLGLYGYWAWGSAAWRVWNDAPLSPWERQTQQQEKRRRRRERSQRFKERFGGGAGPWLASAVFLILLVLSSLLLGLAPVVALCAFPKGSLAGVVSAFGVLLWGGHVTTRFVRRYLN